MLARPGEDHRQQGPDRSSASTQHGHLDGVARPTATSGAGSPPRPTVDLSRPGARGRQHRASRSLPRSTPRPPRSRTLFGPGIDHVPLRRRARPPRRRRHQPPRRAAGSAATSSTADAPALLISRDRHQPQRLGRPRQAARRPVGRGRRRRREVPAARHGRALPPGSSGSSAGEDLGPQYTLDLLSRFNLTADQLFEVFDHCRDVGIEVMCTAWDPPSVDRARGYGIPALKVASADLTNHALLHAHGRAPASRWSSRPACRPRARSARPSTWCRGHGARRTRCCTASRPTRRRSRTSTCATSQRLAEIGQLPGGLLRPRARLPRAARGRRPRRARSSRSTSPSTASMEGNDHKVSLLPGEFAEMVARIREVEEALGTAAPRGGVHRRDDEPRQPRQEPGRRPAHRGRRAHHRRRRRHQEPRPRAPAQRPTTGWSAAPPHRALERRRLLLRHRPRRRGAAGSRTTPSAARGACPSATTTSTTMTARLHARLPRVPLLLQGPRARPGRRCFADRRRPLPMGYACHSPDLFAGDFLLNLASEDDDHWERSITRAAAGHRPDPVDAAATSRARRPRPGRHRQPRRLHHRRAT